MDKSVLITGVAGFFGSRMAQWILEHKKEYTVVGIDNLSCSFTSNIPEGIKFYKINLCDTDFGNIFEKYDIEYVFHFAAFAALGASPYLRTYCSYNNIVSTDAVINQCVNHGVKRLIYTSSMDVYGKMDLSCKNKFRFLETDNPKPIDPYAVSKYACEMNVENAGEIHGLDWCILRPHNFYGAGQSLYDRYRNVLGIWMKNILNNEPMRVYGDGDQVRGFSFIDDHLEQFWNAAVLPSASKQIFNIGSEDNVVTIDQLRRMVSNITGCYNYLIDEKRYEVMLALEDCSKAKRILGDFGETKLEDGIRIMWEWAQKQPKARPYKYPDFEIVKDLPKHLK